MAEQLLDHAQIRAAVQQVRRERVPQRVRAHATRDAGGASRAPHDGVQRAHAKAIVTEAMRVAASICVYTNDQLTVETL